MLNKRSLIAAVVLAALVGTGCATANVKSEEEIGLRKTSLYSEDVVVPEKTQYSKTEPGTGKKFDRAFENAPPMIPHSVEGYLPITRDNNACMGCHMPEVAASMNATPVPKSHFVDFRTQKPLNDLHQGRFNCSACHAPQSESAPLVQNNFQADFRKADSTKKSSLIDSLNEGVR